MQFSLYFDKKYVETVNSFDASTLITLFVSNNDIVEKIARNTTINDTDNVFDDESVHADASNQTTALELVSFIINESFDTD